MEPMPSSRPGGPPDDSGRWVRRQLAGHRFWVEKPAPRKRYYPLIAREQLTDHPVRSSTLMHLPSAAPREGRLVRAPELFPEGEVFIEEEVLEAELVDEDLVDEDLVDPNPTDLDVTAANPGPGRDLVPMPPAETGEDLSEVVDGEVEELPYETVLVQRWVLGFNESAARQMANYLHRFQMHCLTRGQRLLAVTPELVAEYYDGLLGQVTAGTISRGYAEGLISAVRSFFEFCVQTGDLETSPAGASRGRAPRALLAPIIVDKEVPHAHDLVQVFLLAVSSNRNTRRTYETALRDWFGACFRMKVDPMAVRRAHIDAWTESMRERNLSTSSVNNKLSAVRSFYQYCVDEELLERSPARAVKFGRIVNSSKTAGLTRPELQHLLNEARGMGAKGYAAVCLMAFNGLRASEVCSIDVELITSIRGHYVVHVVRKGFTEQVPIPLAPRARGAVEAWVELRAGSLPEDSSEWGWGPQQGPMFYGERGGRWVRQNLWNLMKRLSERAFPGRRRIVHPHELRHTFVTLALDAGASLRDVQDSAGHASADTTRRYDRSRYQLDRNATYSFSSYLAMGDVHAGDDDAERS